jgi:hypothetical protein
MESKKSPAGAIKSGVVLICFLLVACQVCRGRWDPKTGSACKPGWKFCHSLHYCLCNRASELGVLL